VASAALAAASTSLRPQQRETVAATSPASMAAAGSSPGPAGKGAAQLALLREDRREAAFLRLNAFLLRSHAKSLVAALAMDGWLEPREEARLKDRLSDEGEESTKAFVTAYTRFMATEQVQHFVDQLRTSL